MTSLFIERLAFGVSSYLYRRSGLVLVLLVCGAFGPGVFPQNVESRPTARLITSAGNFSRPRRATPPVMANNSAIANPAGPVAWEANPIERRAFEQTNLMREQNGLPPLEWDSDLCRMARNHSEKMARLGYFSHVSPEGSRLRDRARAVGIQRFSVVGENIAYNLGYEDPGAFAVERWMISPGHRANILSADFLGMAIGTFVAADGSVFLTQTFIKR